METAYSIRAIRMINFHNFTDETIELDDGGHLFLLGDNGCGKTTILDAVHYVLTAGLGMEWNSAARMSGPRRDGRKVQGIILRYNLDSGVMNKDGAISYVALEIKGRHGKPLTIGMGISATAMDESIRFWGFIRDCPLSDIPFLLEEEGQYRPCSRQEFKEQLGSGRGFINTMAGYRREIGERLFGGADSYHDICRFLSMGKAYREISAGAADYHALFKRLLPEPRTAIFSEIIEALRSLDGSQAILDDLERKFNWLTELAALVDDITAQHQAMYRYDWLGCYFSLQEITGQQQVIQDNIAAGKTRSEQGQHELGQLEQIDHNLEDRLDTLKAKDTSGLVGQEKRVLGDINDKKTTLGREQEELSQQTRNKRTSEKKLDQLLGSYQKELVAFLPDLAGRATLLPFSISDLQVQLDECLRSKESFMSTDFSIRAVTLACDQELQQQQIKQVRQEDREQQFVDELVGLATELAALAEQSEFLPDLDQYQPCLQAMHHSLLVPRPLYLGLEWQSGVKKQERQHIEECIGQDVLATLFFKDSEYGQARQVAVHYPGIRISGEKRMAAELPEWMRLVFDIQHSDSDCLRCLAMEMASDGMEPGVTLVDGEPLLGFRGHERGFYGHPSRLIGAESRKKAMETEIRGVKQQIKQVGAEKRRLSREIKTELRAQEDLSSFKIFLTDTVEQLLELSAAGRSEQLHYDHCQELQGLQQGRTDAISRDLASLVQLQKELVTRIAGQGLASLERRIKKLRRQKNDNQAAIRTINQKIGGDKRNIVLLQEELLELGTKQQRILKQKEEAGARLLELLPELEDIDYYVLKSRKGQQFKNRQAIEKERTNSEVAARTNANLIREKVNDPEFGGAFRFTYDEVENKLHDFREQSLVIILGQQHTALHEQKDVINEHTRKLFKQIIMSDLLDYLRGHVGDLDRMIRRINSRLAERSFGGQRYCFRLRPLDQYKRLITIIRKISSFDPAAEKELETFFNDHRDALLATESGAIPEELDYRNWYKYELEVSRMGDHGVVMDRRTKSIGSGGEQAVPNYLLILTIAHFLYQGKKIHLHTLLFDEAFYGIDAGRRDQLLGFATDLGLQLFIASPDQDGVRQEVRSSTTLLVKKDADFDVHLYPFHWQNPASKQASLFDQPPADKAVVFDEEL